LYELININSIYLSEINKGKKGRKKEGNQRPPGKVLGSHAIEGSAARSDRGGIEATKGRSPRLARWSGPAGPFAPWASDASRLWAGCSLLKAAISLVHIQIHLIDSRSWRRCFGLREIHVKKRTG
jgi:hypothetical protein